MLDLYSEHIQDKRCIEKLWLCDESNQREGHVSSLIIWRYLIQAPNYKNLVAVRILFLVFVHRSERLI